jgi:hypothetical protein
MQSLAALMIFLASPWLADGQTVPATAPSRLMSEAPAAWKRYETAALDFQGSNTHVRYRGLEPSGPVIEKWRWEFFRLPEVGFRLLQEESDPDVPAVRVRGANPHYRFEARKKRMGDPWVLTLIEKQEPAKRGSYRIREASRQVESGFWAPFALVSIDLNRVVGTDGFRILKEEPMSTAQGQQLAVDLEYRPPRSVHNMVAMKGRVVVDPNLCWVITAANVEVENLGNQRVRMTIKQDFKRRADGIPLIQSRLTRSETMGTEPVQTFCIQSTFDWKTDPPPLSTFYLSDLGIPEPFGIHPPARPTPWWLYAGIAAGVLLIALLLTRWFLLWRTARRAAA